MSIRQGVSRARPPRAAITLVPAATLARTQAPVAAQALALALELEEAQARATTRRPPTRRGETSLLVCIQRARSVADRALVRAWLTTRRRRPPRRPTGWPHRL